MDNSTTGVVEVNWRLSKGKNCENTSRGRMNRTTRRQGSKNGKKNGTAGE